MNYFVLHLTTTHSDTGNDVDMGVLPLAKATREEAYDYAAAHAKEGRVWVCVSENRYTSMAVLIFSPKEDLNVTYTMTYRIYEVQLS